MNELCALLRTHSIDKWCVSFNGGKDSTVVLYLMLEACRKLELIPPLLIFYNQPDEFPEVLSFIHYIVEKHKLRLHTFDCSYKESMFELKQLGIRYILMGQRSTDPTPKKQQMKMMEPIDYFDITNDATSIFRVNLILKWSYANVWKFLLSSSKYEYCLLYSEGYSSLGNTKNTIKNPFLFDAQNNQYKHASELQNGDELEREGRL